VGWPQRPEGPPERQRHRGEDDVVDRAAQLVLDRLELGEVGVDPRVAAVRADLDVQRRGRRRGASSPTAPPRAGGRAGHLAGDPPGRAGDRPRDADGLAGTVARSTSASASSCERDGGGLATHGPRVLVRAGRRLGGDVEEHGGDVDARHAVDQGVVGLGDQREAVVVDAVDEPDLPQRAAAVQALGEQPPGQALELLVVARRRQPGVAQVVAQVEVRVVDPDRPALARTARRRGAGGSAARGPAATRDGRAGRRRRAPARGTSSPTPRACGRGGRASNPRCEGRRSRGRSGGLRCVRARVRCWPVDRRIAPSTEDSHNLQQSV
jgi:hypothetical protein